MAAVRVARAHTGRDGVLKISGSYNGHHDTAMAGRPRRGGATGGGRGRPHRPLQRRRRHGAANRRPRAGLRPHGARDDEHRAGAARSRAIWTAVREVTRRHGVVLIFDEVKTGLTIAPGGATERFGVEPDMVALAKALGGGLPSRRDRDDRGAGRGGRGRPRPAVRHLQRQPAGHGRGARQPARGPHAGGVRAARAAGRAAGGGLRGRARRAAAGRPRDGPRLQGQRELRRPSPWWTTRPSSAATTGSWPSSSGPTR